MSAALSPNKFSIYYSKEHPSFTFDFTFVCPDGELYFSAYMLSGHDRFERPILFADRANAGVSRSLVCDYPRDVMKYVLLSLDSHSSNPLELQDITSRECILAIYTAAHYYDCFRLMALCNAYIEANPSESYLHLAALYDMSILWSMIDYCIDKQVQLEQYVNVDEAMVERIASKPSDRCIKYALDITIRCNVPLNEDIILELEKPHDIANALTRLGQDNYMSCGAVVKLLNTMNAMHTQLKRRVDREGCDCVGSVCTKCKEASM